MTKILDIIVQNKFVKDKRDINVYHHADKSAHIISYNSTFTFHFNMDGVDGEKDYLHISMVYGPGHLRKEYLVNMPSWAEFEFSSEGKLTLTHNSSSTVLKLPPGPPQWQLKISGPGDSPIPHAPAYPADQIIIGDIETNIELFP